MGIWEQLGARFVPELDDIELGMAGDPAAPAEILRRMAAKEPKLWDALLANPSYPQDVREYISAQRGDRA